MSGPNDPIKTIGQILKGNHERDAIHVAILPVKAAEPLVQGTTVKVDNLGRATHARREEAIGIIDPFLPKAVEMGEKCWVFLFPGTVTGMRHHWSLPAVDGEGLTATRAKSIEWLNQYAAACKIDYDEFIEAVTEFVNNGCTSATMEDNFSDYQVTDEFWTHFKSVTGLVGNGHFWTCCL